MEQQPSTPNFQPVPQPVGEQLSNNLPQPEAPQLARQAETAPERPAVELQPAGPVAPAPVAPPTVVPVKQAASAVPTQDDPTVNPVIAADNDVIEKEWVDRAKQIVMSTKDNPYEREREAGKLQADYINKRFGINVKLVDD